MSLVLFDFCLIYFGIGVLEVLSLHVAVGIEGYTEATEKILFYKIGGALHTYTNGNMETRD